MSAPARRSGCHFLKVGNNAVGMITATGPLSGVWLVLAGNETGGAGTFGHIGATGEMGLFNLESSLLGTNAGLLHIANTLMATEPALWLLSTTTESNKIW